MIKKRLLLVYFLGGIFLKPNFLWAEESPPKKSQEKHKTSGPYNIKVLFGLETPGEGARTDQGALFKTFLSGGNILKYSTSFGLTIAKNYTQGEFSLGGQIYPLNFYRGTLFNLFYLRLLLVVTN